jgi:UDP-N-acetylglucosamine 2-epimerase (non-hydrolysing)
LDLPSSPADQFFGLPSAVRKKVLGCFSLCLFHSLNFNYLVKHAKGVITDSGGITEETTVLGVPCLTLRDNTERPETITIGTNELIGTDPSKLPPALARLMTGQWKKGAIPPKWDGKAAERIVEHLERLVLTS